LHHKETRNTKRKGRKEAIIAVFFDGGGRRWNQFYRQQKRVVLFLPFLVPQLRRLREYPSLDPIQG
jgi:hypothetical protein